MKSSKFIKIFLLLPLLAAGQQHFKVPLWPEAQIPYRIETDEKEAHERNGILRISKVQTPELEVFLPETTTATGKALLIFPGGGYHILAYEWEGTEFAEYLNNRGVAGIVVKYRLPTSASTSRPEYTPLADAQRAIRLVRENASAWNIDPNEIGVMGFSAGGHLAASVSNHYAKEIYDPVDKTDSLSAAPDFSILIYPVISFISASSHSGSRKALLGETGEKDDLLEFFSLETQVDSLTPPTLLVHATDDTGVPVENSLLYYQALKKNDIEATLLVFPKGGHGFGRGEGKPYLDKWPEYLSDWILRD